MLYVLRQTRQLNSKNRIVLFHISRFHKIGHSSVMKVQKVQRHVTKQIPGLRHISYQERLKRLNWPILSFTANQPLVVIVSSY